MVTTSTITYGRPISKTVWAWARLLGGASVLAVLLWQVGTGPFLEGLRALDAPAVIGAFGIGALTTLCCAWRWSLIAAGLGVKLPLGPAVAAYYRSQFLNVTLPGGVLGDVHRAVRHGLDIGDVGLGVRAVVLERLAGQVVHAAVALVLLFALPSPVQPYMPTVALVAGLVGLTLFVIAGLLSRSPRWLRVLRTAGRDIRNGLLARNTFVGVVFASLIVVLGHLATFVLAAVTAGSTAPVSAVLPLALLALSAMVLPLNIAGWGPREGVAAWAFAAAGMTATLGVATAVTYGVLVFVASLPGAAVLALRWTGQSAAQPAIGQGGSHG